MTTAMEWQGQVGQSWAGAWRQTDRAFAGITAHLLDLIARLPGEEVLDVGCGAGELSLALARRRATARVTGIDLSPDLIESACKRADPHARVAFHTADAVRWQPSRRPDLIVSRHGVMFFDDPVAAFAHLRAIAVPGARLGFSCFRDLAHNGWASEPARTIGVEVAPPRGSVPGPFSFADRDFVTRVLGAAGWSGIAHEAHEVAFVVGQGEGAVDQALDFFSRIGPTAPRFNQLDEAERAVAKAKLRVVLEDRLRDRVIAYRAAIWLVSAHG